MMLQFPELAKLKTKKIVFEDVFVARDSVSLEHLKELSSKRRVIQDSINQTSFLTEAIAREIYGGSTSRCQQERLRLEQYLPLLENFIYHVEFVGRNSQIDRWISQLKIQWSSVLGLSSFFNLTGLRFSEIGNLRFELGMTLFLYGAILRERAFEFLPSDLKQSAFIFREAAGVFYYLAHEVLPHIHPATSAEKPPEATPSVTAALSLICLADAQAVCITKAEEIGNTRFGVLAKLHLGVAELLYEATTCLNSGVGEYKSISSRFLEFILTCGALHELRSQKYFAESLKTDDGQVGVAIGVLRDALNMGQKKMPVDGLWKSVLRTEIKNAADILRKFESENEFVWHEKVPSGDELPLLQGNRIVKIEPYKSKRWERELAFKM
ncbi:Endosomal targeting BRO1-like domain-containing protein [Euphorbia peplus]|nr:Endosomal targeting BRO1-like domain-containing protein [Euphorbia peplus]